MIDRVAPGERTVGTKEGQIPWTREAIKVLCETASHYNATITHSELAEQVQRRTKLRTKAQARSWIGGVLGMVAMACHGRQMPPLTSLVVHKHDGQVGKSYDQVLKVAGEQPIENPIERERHAASARLECYKKFCEALPKDAEPTLTSQVRTKVAKAEKPTRVVRSTVKSVKPTPVEEVRAPVCPRCFLQLPTAGGECQNC